MEQPIYFLPAKDEPSILRQGVMSRKFIGHRGVSFVLEYVVLMQDRLLISKQTDPDRRVFDDVLLKDVTECDLEEIQNGEDPAELLEVIIRTNEDGYNCGRSYIYQSTRMDAEAWEKEVDKAVIAAKIVHREEELQGNYGHSTFLMLRERVKAVYEGLWFQYFVAAMIIAGFMGDVLEAQVLPAAGSSEATNFFWAELSVTIFYTLELCTNMFVNSHDCFRPFYSQRSNWFDAGTVIVSIVSVTGVLRNLPIKMLRLIRVLRLAKLFKEFRQMTRMCVSIAYCIIPMLNAFFLLLIVTIIFAVLGTSTLGARSPAFFGTFHTSLFTLFQVHACSK